MLCHPLTLPIRFGRPASITQIVEVPVETVIERMDVHPQINTVEFEVEEWKIRDREKVIERVVRVPINALFLCILLFPWHNGGVFRPPPPTAFNMTPP